MKNIDQQTDKHADGIIEDRKQAPPAYFIILFYGLIIWGVIFIAYFLLSGWSSQQEFEEKMGSHTSTYSPAALPAKAAGVIEANLLFAENCAGCHGEDGKGGFGPDLSQDYEYGKNPAAVKISITKGRSEKMPAFGGKLGAEEIDALVQYILKF